MSPTMLPAAPRKEQGLQRPPRARRVPGLLRRRLCRQRGDDLPALSTHTGLVANEPYRKGLHYNERIAADARQAQLGWVETLEVTPGRARQPGAGRAGRPPVRSLKIEGVLGRPSTNRHDIRLALAEQAPGRYEAQVRTARRRQLDRHAGGLRRGGRGRAHLPHTEAPVAEAVTDTARRLGQAKRRPNTELEDLASWVIADARPNLHTATTTLVVENMHCGGCMRKVEAALAGVPGVASARANLSARRVTAVHGAAGVNSADLVEALAGPDSRRQSLPRRPRARRTRATRTS